jgi:hypothetical protein
MFGDRWSLLIRTREYGLVQNADFTHLLIFN